MKKNLLNARNVAMSLHLDWATHKAAKYAVEHWHYSQCLPAGKVVKIGVWEDKKFIGVVLFSRGATPNLLKPYGLTQYQGCELTRVALTNHKSTVSKVVSIAIKLLKRQSPKLRIIVSFADPSETHHGGIYQAGNWVYTGAGSKSRFWLIFGKKTHPRSVIAKGGFNSLIGAKNIDKNAKPLYVQGKHRYLMPLDKAMRKQIEPLSKPYPKREKQGNEDFQSLPGGATPTLTLQAI
jgi:hypothetical protein